VELNDVPPEFIFNWDQTGILLVPSSEDKKRISIVGHGDKRQITAIMCGALTGEVLPIRIVYPVDAIHLMIFLLIG